jgi:hypothetical protein
MLRLNGPFANEVERHPGRSYRLCIERSLKHFCPNPSVTGIMSVIVNNRPDVVPQRHYRAPPQGRTRLEFHGPRLLRPLLAGATQ